SNGCFTFRSAASQAGEYVTMDAWLAKTGAGGSRIPNVAGNIAPHHHRVPLEPLSTPITHAKSHSTALGMFDTSPLGEPSRPTPARDASERSRRGNLMWSHGGQTG